jgi:hypothetical protein
MSGFNSLQYFCAISPIDVVIDAFINEEQKKMLSTSDDHCAWSIRSQGRFATLMASRSENIVDGKEIDWSTIQFVPSERYVRKLVMRYTTRLELQGREVEDDNLASLICFLSRSRISNLPDPTSHCNATYFVPLSTSYCQCEQNDDELQLTIRIYPQHNDVGVAKVWEAGAALAEYIIHNPTIIKGRNVVELGAGVGLTGLVAAAFGAKSIHMTDYTDATLENLSHNVTINESWLRNRGVDPSTVNVVSTFQVSIWSIGSQLPTLSPFRDNIT